ncbi:MAG: hypothetical protein RLZZ133_376, partial [Pseudomonadota bacterium]
EHGCARYRVQHFWRVAFHTTALASGKHNDVHSLGSAHGNAVGIAGMRVG